MGKPTSVAGWHIDRPRNVLYSLDLDFGTIAALDPGSLKEIKSAPVGTGRMTWPSLVRVTSSSSPTGPAARCCVLDPADLRTTAPDRRRRASQPDRRSPQGRPALRRLRVEQLRLGDRHQARRSSPRRSHTALFPQAPEGSTPDALAIAPDGETLYVANADNNCVAVDRHRARRAGARSRASSPPAGIRPPWPSRPTARRCSSASARGTRRRPTRSTSRQPSARRTPSPTARRRHAAVPATSARRSRARSRSCRFPTRRQLAAYTDDGLPQLPVLRQAADRRPASRARRPSRRRWATRRRSSTCIYIIKENRTYDQVFGDITRGNGDPALVMFGERGHAQPSQAGRRVRPARQPLLQRPRLGRRPSLVDDGLQHRLHRPQLGPDLLAAATGIDDDDDGDLRERPLAATSGTRARGTA